MTPTDAARTPRRRTSRSRPSPEFVGLRKTLRGFVFPMTVAFFLWYALYVVLSAYARDFMGTKVVGNINVALVFGLLQFVTTFLIAWLYARFAEPQARPGRRRAPGRDRGEGGAMTYLAAVDAGTQRTHHHHRCSWSSSSITLGITFWASRQTRNATDFYAGGRSFSGFQNGMAIGGDYMSAASFLGIAGIIALNGYDGFLYSIGFLVAWLVALLLVAELLRNSGKYTMADVLAFRMRQRPVRTAAAVSTVTVSIFYLLAQMVGAGALVALLLGIKPGHDVPRHGRRHREDRDDRPRRRADDRLRDRRRHEGHHLRPDRQGVPADGRRAADDGPGAGGTSSSTCPRLLGDAAAQERQGRRRSWNPGLRYGKEVAGNALQTFYNKIDLLSLGLALVLGTAGLPHILIRFYTVPTARTARRSVLWAIGIIGTFYLFTLALGFGAAALVGSEAITRARTRAATPPHRSWPRRSASSSSAATSAASIFLAVIAAVAFATILAVVAGLTLASSSSLAHDFYANVIKQGQGVRAAGGRVARISALVIGAVVDRAGDLRPEPQRGLPGGAGVRGRRVGQPAGDPLLAVLEAVQHHRRGLRPSTAV